MVGLLYFSSSATVYGQPDSLPVTEDTPETGRKSIWEHTKQDLRRHPDGCRQGIPV